MAVVAIQREGAILAVPTVRAETWGCCQCEITLAHPGAHPAAIYHWSK